MQKPEFWYQLESYLQQFEWLQNGGMDYMRAILAFIVIFFGLKVFERVVVRKIKSLSLRTKTHIDDHLIAVLDAISSFFYFYVSLYGASKFLMLPELAHQVLDSLLIIVVFAEIIKIVLKLTDLVFAHANEEATTSGISGIKMLIKIGLWVTGILLMFSNLGINVSALMASLGIGGIAVALAAQNILSDLFASFTIYFDRPFEIGDYIVLGTDKGTVQKIGLKSTRIKTLQGEELVVSNQELTSARIQNFKKMEERRISFQLGIEYGTPNAKLKKIVPTVKKIIDDLEITQFTRGHFIAFGDFSLDFEFVYFVDSSDYTEYANTHQEINFAIKEAFEKLGIEMAFPTQTLHVVKG
ncbi:MAG TPA: mechanosensitive ion channel family protein [Candidatus Gracilibacteria bacterium]